MSFQIMATAFAQAAAEAGPKPSVFESLLIPLMGFMAIMYFLIIRPQQKRAKEHTRMITGLKKGDEVVTSGGLIGKVRSVADTFFTIEIAPNTSIKVMKSSVTGLTKQPENGAAKHGVKAPAKA